MSDFDIFYKEVDRCARLLEETHRLMAVTESYSQQAQVHWWGLEDMWLDSIDTYSERIDERTPSS